MNTLATDLRNAVLGVLVARYSLAGLTDEDYGMLNAVSTMGDLRENPDKRANIVADVEAKLAAYRREQPQMQADAPGQVVPTMPPAAPLGAAPPAIRAPNVPVFPGMPDPAPAGALAPDTSEQQEALPLGTADRGPDPQDVGTLLSTDAPLDGSAVDPSDPPFDYARLPSQKTAGSIA